MSGQIDPKELERILRPLSPEQRELVMRSLEEQSRGETETFEQIKDAVFDIQPPPLDEFIYSNEFLGIPRGRLYPAVEDLLHRIDDPSIREVWICAGKGSGKSTLTSITMARQAHIVAVCMRDPSSYFMLLPGALTAIVNMSISAPQAENVIFNKFWNLLTFARCFNDIHGNPIFNKKKRHIVFPNNVHALSGHSGYEAYFGYDTFCGVLDEFAWFKDNEDRSISDEVYSAILGSCKTRFPGFYKIVAISSPQSQDGPIMRRVEGARTSGIEPDIIGEVDGDSYAKVISG